MDEVHSKRSLRGIGIGIYLKKNVFIQKLT